jgi:hypothetical protein
MTTKIKHSSKAPAKTKHASTRRAKACTNTGRIARARVVDVDTPKGRGQFAGLSIPQLRAMYLEVVGRETASSDRDYLTWKMREAKAGRVPVGPRAVRAATDMTTLPFRIPITASEAMDEVWRAAGAKSRNRFMQEAISRHLASLGETDAAELFATPRVGAP